MEHPVSLIDIFPTLEDICQLKGENRKNENGALIGGFSLQPFLEHVNTDAWEGPEGALTAIATDVVDYELAAQTFSYRTTNYRLVLYPNGQEEFYDLTVDQHEWNNLASEAKFEAKKKELKKSVLVMIEN